VISLFTFVISLFTTAPMPSWPPTTARLPAGTPGKLGRRLGGMLPAPRGAAWSGYAQVHEMPYGFQRGRSSLVARHREGITIERLAEHE
jgi:hypothetical protein